MSKPKTSKQCRTCPWRVDASVDDIPNYRRELHEKLTSTIATEPRVPLPGEALRLMACHYSTEKRRKPCVGWLHNQLGPGNNIAVRLRVMTGNLPVPKVVGEQHETFQDTLCVDNVTTCE